MGRSRSPLVMCSAARVRTKSGLSTLRAAPHVKNAASARKTGVRASIRRRNTYAGWNASAARSRTTTPHGNRRRGAKATTSSFDAAGERPLVVEERPEEVGGDGGPAARGPCPSSRRPRPRRRRDRSRDSRRSARPAGGSRRPAARDRGSRRRCPWSFRRDPRAGRRGRGAARRSGASSARTPRAGRSRAPPWPPASR